MNRQRATAVGAAFASVLFYSTPAAAIPAFARAYHVPCSTCHDTITRRNETGDAFRRAGFRWPAELGIDAEIRDPPPQEMTGVALLDGLLPAQWPFSLAAILGGALTTDPDAETLTLGTPGLKLLFGAPLGEHLSVFGRWAVGAPPEEVYVHVARILGRPELNVKLGMLEQQTTLFRNNESLIAPYAITSRSINGHVVGRGRLGAEASGIVFGRTFWAAGAVMNGDPISHVDAYYHLSAKLGGATFLGEEPEVDLEDPTLLDDVSLTVAHWGYWGRVKEPDGTTTAGVRRLGLDGKLRFRELSVWGGVMLGIDRDRVARAETMNLTLLAEVSYQLFSWLTPVYLYQYHDSSRLEVAEQTHDAGAVVLVLENLRARAVFSFSDNGRDDEAVNFQLLVAL